ncbi:MAG: hypothetical protein JW993_12335 [Sedimentisphaerales bacterium]|nr:hypothetical protein [Sedimentisphaerales bacterium]
MKRLGMSGFVAVAVAVSVSVNSSAWAGELVAWGSDLHGQVSGAPTGADYVAIAAGDTFGLALTSGGAVVAWGQNSHGQRNVPAGTYTAIGAGARFGLAIRSDGSIAAWGEDSLGQVSAAPKGDDFIAVDGGLTFAVALKGDGSLVAWGDDRWGQVSGVPKGTGFTAVAAGDTHAVALRSNGSLVSWGYPTATNGMPATGSFRAVDAGGNQSLALTTDGVIVWWGEDPYDLGLAQVPDGTGFQAVAAGYLHALALSPDGSVVGWGAGATTSAQPDFGQANPPKRNDFVAVAGGLFFSLGLTGQTEQVLLADDFDDNRKAVSWDLVGDDLANCRLEETSQRLELRATAKSDELSASYLSNGWGIDPTAGFSLKVDFRAKLTLGQAMALSVVLTPSVKSADMEYVRFGVGSNSFTPHYLVDAKSQTNSLNRLLSRNQADGTLYLSYDADRDDLYLSFTGYGAADAWAVARGYLQGAWGGRVLSLELEGRSDRLPIGAGDAYFDNFVVESGNLVVTEFDSVARFWSPVLGDHFFTIDDEEADDLIVNLPDVWTFEGTAFRAATTRFASGLAPVYRFWSDRFAKHFYTISEAEKDTLLKAGPAVWTFEGIAFYAYPQGQQPVETRPVYRFWKPSDNAHFYTLDEIEKDTVLKKYRDVYVFEGVAFYALEP